MPNAEEMRNDPKARDEGLARLDDLPDEHLVSMIDEFKQEAESATKADRARWQDYFDLWEGERDYGEKEEWQAKMVVEKPFTAVEQATAQIQRALLDSPEFLRAEGKPALWGPTVEFWEQYLRAAFEKSQFIPKYTDSVQVGMITGVGMYMKPRWNRFTVTTHRGTRMPVSFLSISNVAPWKIYRDPSSRPREQWSGLYLIHSDKVDLHVLEGNKIYINIDQLAGEPGSDSSSYSEGEDKGRPRDFSSKYRRQKLVDEYWGDVLDSNGHLVATDILMAKSGKILIREPAAMPHKSWDTNTGRQRWPFITSTPFIHPHRFEGRGIIQQVVDLILSYENGMNLTSDAMNWQLNNPTEIDVSLLANPTDTKVEPGKSFARKTRTQGNAVQPLQYAKDFDLQKAMAWLEYLDKGIQNGSFINEFVVGLPGYRSDITKGEVQIKTAQSMAIFDRMGRTIELAGKDFADLAYDMCVQYTDESTLPVIGGMLPQDQLFKLAMAPLEVRYALMRADLQIKFTGVSQALQRAEQLRRLMQIAVLAGNPLFLGRIENPSDMMRVMIELLGYADKIKVLDNPVLPGVVPGAEPGGGGGGGGGPNGPGSRNGSGPGAAGLYPGINGGGPRGVGEPPRLDEGDGGVREQGLFQGVE